MDSDTRTVITTAALAAAGIAAYLIAEGGGILRFSDRLEIAATTAGWEPDSYGDGYSHTKQPGELKRRAHGHHPLYRRPAEPGANVTAVMSNGWGWFADPPEAEGIGG